MQNHNHVLMSLEMEFKRLDRMFANGEMRVFGRDTERIFGELDVIRRKQIELAREHISLETINDLPQQQQRGSQHHFADNNEIEHGYQQSLDSFKNKEIGLKKLMLKLDDLGEEMNRFRELSDPEMHYYSNHGYESNNTNNAAHQFDFMEFDDVDSPLSTPRQEHHQEPLNVLAFDQTESQSSSQSNIAMRE
ncbi:hypothetical protein BJV82DRAFT_617500 [Fennellomyces sp. T-0311]|nr:hypothetical protein BJV82DRAFT_617500 [Fennellomyces sp. T-0311]